MQWEVFLFSPSHLLNLLATAMQRATRGWRQNDNESETRQFIGEMVGTNKISKTKLEKYIKLFSIYQILKANIRKIMSQKYT